MYSYVQKLVAVLFTIATHICSTQTFKATRALAYPASGRGQRSESSSIADSGEKTVSVLSSTSTGGGDMLLGLGGLSGGRSSSSGPPSSALGGRGGGGRFSSNMTYIKNSNISDFGCALNRTATTYTRVQTRLHKYTEGEGVLGFPTFSLSIGVLYHHYMQYSLYYKEKAPTESITKILTLIS